MAICINNKKKKVIYIAMSIHGGLAFIFGVVAAFNGIKQRDETFKVADDLSYCKWPSTPAGGLGISACFLILTAQITSNACGGCVCCYAKHGSLTISSKTGAIACLVFSWTQTILASTLLFVGGIYNSGAIHMQLDVLENGLVLCHYPHTWPLLAGGVISLVATGSSLLFFHIIANSKSDDNIDACGFPPFNNVQLPTVMNASTKNNEEFPPASFYASPPDGSHQAAIPVASNTSAGYY